LLNNPAAGYFTSKPDQSACWEEASRGHQTTLLQSRDRQRRKNEFSPPNTVCKALLAIMEDLKNT
jgi:hypothetical protein